MTHLLSRTDREGDLFENERKTLAVPQFHIFEHDRSLLWPGSGWIIVLRVVTFGWKLGVVQHALHGIEVLFVRRVELHDLG